MKKMAESPKGKAILTVGEVTMEEALHKTPTDPDEDKDGTVKNISSTTDREGEYTAGDSSAAENLQWESSADSIEKSSGSFGEKQNMKLLWDDRQLKATQHDFLKRYINKAFRVGRFNWYERFGEESSKTPELLEDVSCDCHPEEYKNTEKECKKGDVQAKLEKSETSATSRFAKLSIRCQVRRISLYFSRIAEYFIGEAVNPDLFLFIPIPGEKRENDPVCYEYSIVQETRKILILKLKEGLRTRLEDGVDGMTEDDRIQYRLRNEFRVENHLVLNTLLENLVLPYETFNDKSREDKDCSPQKPSKQAYAQIYRDKRRLESLRTDYRILKKQPEDEFVERYFTRLAMQTREGNEESRIQTEASNSLVSQSFTHDKVSSDTLNPGDVVNSGHSESFNASLNTKLDTLNSSSSSVLVTANEESGIQRGASNSPHPQSPVRDQVSSETSSSSDEANSRQSESSANSYHTFLLDMLSSSILVTDPFVFMQENRPRRPD